MRKLLLSASFADEEKEYKDIKQLMQVTIPHSKLLAPWAPCFHRGEKP